MAWSLFVFRMGNLIRVFPLPAHNVSSHSPFQASPTTLSSLQLQPCYYNLPVLVSPSCQPAMPHWFFPKAPMNLPSLDSIQTYSWMQGRILGERGVTCPLNLGQGNIFLRLMNLGQVNFSYSWWKCFMVSKCIMFNPAKDGLYSQMWDKDQKMVWWMISWGVGWGFEGGVQGSKAGGNLEFLW